MFIDFILDNLNKNLDYPIIVWRDREFTCKDLIKKMNSLDANKEICKIKKGSVVGIKGDFSPNTIALLLVLIMRECIIVPLSSSASSGVADKVHLAGIDNLISIDHGDSVKLEELCPISNNANDLYSLLRSRQHPGLVLFSSGTSGHPKAAVHDFTGLLSKFKVKRKPFRAINFLLFDHWGGLNTLFHTLSNTGTIVIIDDRSPETVCRTVQDHAVDLLPTTPTFLNLLLISRAYEKYDLSSLRVISYGAEPMPESTLRKLNKVFPEILIQQTYGLIEVGVLRSYSENNNSLWVKLGGEGYKLRVVDGILQIKSNSTILGYLNAESPITEDGWFITGDVVETNGDFYKILGRNSEVINVGGEKVYPSEVESYILKMPEVLEATVFGESNVILGNIVCARIRLSGDANNNNFESKLKKFLSDKIEKYKVPVKILIEDKEQFSDRMKKKRSVIKQ